jgi:hypothetical protein
MVLTDINLLEGTGIDSLDDLLSSGYKKTSTCFSGCELWANENYRALYNPNISKVVLEYPIKITPQFVAREN